MVAILAAILDFNQELKIRLKQREILRFCALNEK